MPRSVAFLRGVSPLNASMPALEAIERDGASILAFTGSEALSAYVPGPKGPAFMSLLERTFGADVTTRTLDTVRMCAWA